MNSKESPPMTKEFKKYLDMDNSENAPVKESPKMNAIGMKT